MGDDPFTPEQLQQLATPTYRTRKVKEQKTVSASPVCATPTLVDLSQVNVLGRVEGEKAGKKIESTPAGKKNQPDESKKPTKKKSSSSKPTSDDLKNLDDKRAQRSARPEAMLLAKSFAVPVELVKPATVVTTDQPFFILVPVPV